jgi:hypothetical protein
MRRLVLSLCAAAVALFGAHAATSPAATAAAGAAPPDIPQSHVFASGKLLSLRPGVTYQASRFPIPLRVTPPDASWGAAQWKANQFGTDAEKAGQHLMCSTNPKVCAPPYYGWVAIGPAGTYSSGPPGLVAVLAGYSRVPSVATTVANLRRGKNLELQPARPVRLAGFSGREFEGHTGAGKHYFIPFTPPNHRAAGGGAADLIQMDGADHPFRFDVLDVRGKTVVVLVGSLVLSPGTFPAFRTKADRLLRSLRFPGSS